jgi:hypothetical protein
MWQFYAFMARDISADRQREAESARRRHLAAVSKPRRHSAGIVRRLINGRDEG